MGFHFIGAVETHHSLAGHACARVTPAILTFLFIWGGFEEPKLAICVDRIPTCNCRCFFHLSPFEGQDPCLPDLCSDNPDFGKRRSLTTTDTTHCLASPREQRSQAGTLRTMRANCDPSATGVCIPARCLLQSVHTTSKLALCLLPPVLFTLPSP